MLHHVHIKSFGIIQEQSLTVSPLLTTITGETGAGKSILMDAILFALNLPTRRSRELQPNTSVTLVFELPHNHPIHPWCEAHGFAIHDEVFIRRSATLQQRTRCYLNDQPISLQQVKSLAPLLIQITGQHSHQYLTQSKTQRDILDHFGNLMSLRSEVSSAYEQWQICQQKLNELTEQATLRADQLQLLNYQCEELDALSLNEGDVEDLLTVDKQHQHQEALRHSIHQLHGALSHIIPMISQHNLSQWEAIFPSLEHSIQMQEQLGILLPELDSELNAIKQSININPEQLHEHQERLTQCHDLARKHRIDIRLLHQHHQTLLAERSQLLKADDDLSACQQASLDAEAHYQSLAQNLSDQRHQASLALAQTLNQELPNIGMPHGLIEVRTNISQTARSHGMDDVVFWIQTNPGQPIAPISDSVSGGELSRLSLLIKTLTPPVHATSLIFDEVDTGIGGSVANIIAQLLHKASSYQALCITHLPQVAACGQQQWHVTKHQSQHDTHTDIKTLSQAERVLHLAQLMSGLSPSESSTQEAQALLAQWDHSSINIH